NYDEKFWINIDTKSRENEGFVSCKTKENPFGTEVFTVCAYMKNNISKDSLEYTYNNEDYLANNSYTFEVDENETVSIEKFVSVVTSRDFSEENLVTEAKIILDVEFEKGFEKCLDEHSKSWNERFNICDIKISGDKLAQQGIRYNLFQLLSTYSGEDSRLNIGPKGFTGEKYGGATYWDTEAYCLPVYLGTSKSEVSRNLLIYRYNQLEKAKENSKKLGLKGALYPMVTFNGEECHNEWEITFEEIHRNASIVYGIYNYTNYTGDTSYISEYGIDVIVEVARFFASRVHLSTRKNIYMMHGVTGPNEYENNVNNNWYTSFMGKWCLEYASENIKNLNSKEINNRLKISNLEIDTWDDISSKMYLPYDEELDIIVQHDNFLDKEFIEVKDLDKKDLPINQKWSWDKILRSCFIKQADVLQGIYYFLEKFSETEIKNNFDFYEKYTVHESSLSSSIYSIIASQIGYLDKAYELYSRTARLDLDNYNNDTEDGLHITSMSGAWISIVQGFAGMRTFSTLEFSPKLPSMWKGYSFSLNYRENIINIEVSSDKVIIINIKGNEIKLKVYGNEYCVIDKIELDRI
ncbi:MAG: family 65 glycosyl hydrolase domain-containing protein, partial [Peptostreptococcaceae bacterium]